MDEEVKIPRSKIKGRLFTFTHEQVELLQEALSIAEKNYHEVHTKVSELFKAPEGKQVAKYYFDKGNQFYDLRNELGEGKFDL